MAGFHYSYCRFTMLKLLLVMGSLLPYRALAGGDDVYVTQTAGDATEVTQLANNVLLKENSNYQKGILDHQSKMLITQSDMLARQLEQLMNMTQNTKKVPNSLWSNTSDLLRQLAQAVRQGQALSYASQNIDENFKNKYPGYRPSNDFSKDYQDWSTTSMDAIRGAMIAANLQANEFTTEDKMINRLRHLSQTTEGRMQAIQVGNMVAMENVQQMRKLRQLQMAQMQAQNNHLASVRQENLAKKAASDKFFNVGDPTLNRKYKLFKGGSEK